MDTLDQTIVARLAERQRKLDFISLQIRQQQQTASTPSWKKYYYSIGAVAAILVIAAIVTPLLRPGRDVTSLRVTPPEFDLWRGAKAMTMEEAIDVGDFERAWALNISALEESSEQLDELRGSDDEEEIYLYNIEMAIHSELIWTKVFLASKLNRAKEMRKALQQYLKCKGSLPHAHEAEQLLAKI